MATRKIASLLVDLVARTSSFRGELTGAAKSTKRFSDRVQQSSDTVTRYGRTLIAVATTGALAVWIKRSLAAADATAKTADKLGIATEQLIGLRHAAEQTAGVTGQTLDTALQRMVRRVAEAAQGTGEARNALKELRLDAEQLARLSPDQQFAAIADAMQGVSEQGDRVRLAMRLFDTEGVALVNTLRVGSEGLQNFQSDAERLGITLSRVDAAKVEAANDALDRAGKMIAGVGQRLAVDLAPFIEAATERLVKLGSSSSGFKDTISSSIDTATTVLGFFADSLQGLELIWEGLKAGVLKYKLELVDSINESVKAVQRLRGRIANLGEIFDAVSAVARVALENPFTAMKFAVAATVRFIASQLFWLLEKARAIALNLGLDDMVTSVEQAQDKILRFSDQVDRSLRSGDGAKELQAALDGLHATLAKADAGATGLESLNRVSEETRQSIAAVNAEIDRLKQQPLASSQVQRFAEEIKADAELAAQAAAASAPGSGIEPTDAAGDPTSEDPTKLQERLQQRLDTLRDFGILEREQIALEFQLKQEQLRSALENELLTKQEFAEAEAKLATDREKTLTVIEKQGNQLRFQDAQNAAGAALELAQAFGDKAIGLQKVLSLVQSGIAIATGIARAQELGFPANIAEALRVAALGVRVINTIRGASRAAPNFSPSSVATGGGASGAGTAAADASDPTRNTAAERDERQQGGKLIVPDTAALDARQLAAIVNEAGRQGFVFDGIQFGGAPA